MSAREHRPDDALAVDVHAARREALHRRLRVVPRHLVVLGQRRLRRVSAGNETHERARHPLDRSPDRAVRRRRVAVVLHVEPLVLGWIRRLIRFRVGVALPVAVVVEDERAPALRQLLVVRLVPDLRVEPALDAGGPERRPQHVVVVEIHVAPREARIDRRRLLGLRIVDLEPALALIDREQLRRRMIRSRLAPRRRLGLADARRGPHATLLVHGEAVHGGLAVPDHFVAPVRRRRRRRRVRRARRLRIANDQLDLARRVPRRIDDRPVIAALFQRAVDGTVGVHGGIALVGRDLVVQIDLRIRPVPHRDHDVPLAALRTRRARPRAARRRQSGPSSPRTSPARAAGRPA